MEITSDVVPIDATASDGMSGTVPVTVNPSSGNVQITGGTGIFTFNTTDVDVCPGDTVWTYFLSSSFTDVATFSYTLDWSASLADLTFVEATYVDLPGPSALYTTGFNTTQVANGKLGFIWFQNSLAGFTYANDGDTLLQMCFVANGPDATTIDFVFNDDINTTEAGNTDGAIPSQTDPGSVTITSAACGNPPPTVTGVVTDVALCFGDSTGAIDITVAGGNPGFMYSWTGSGMFTSTDEDLTNIPAGTYDVTITDNLSLTVTDSYVIVEPTALDLSSTTVSASCNGGTDGEIDLTATGGTGMLTFLWNDSGNSTDEDLTGLTAGTYKVIVTDANGCKDSLEVTVDENVAFTISGVATNITCNGDADGSIDLTVTGNTTAATYAWSNGAGTDEDPTGLAPNTYHITVTADNCEVIDSFTVTEPDVLTASTTPTHATCGGGGVDGSIDLTASGGTGPYTYSWDNSLGTVEDPTGLASNTYCVTVTDANDCTTTTCETIVENGNFTISGVETNVSCNGNANGGIDLTVTGASGTQTYNWDNGSTSEDLAGLGPDTYRVTVIDNGCEVIDSFVITEPMVLSAVPIPTGTSCNGAADGSIDLTVTGGTMPFSYSWDNSAGTDEDPTGLSADTYCVTVTDANDCVITTCAMVTEPTAINISGTVTDQTSSMVDDGVIDITVTGGTTPYVGFNWVGLTPFTSMDMDLTGLAPGIYDLTVTDNAACTQTASYVVAPADFPVVTNVVITDALCVGQASGGVDITVSGGAMPYTFVWDNGPPATTSEDLTSVPPGTYSVTITDASMSSIVAGPYTVGQATPITYSETHLDASCNGLFDGEIHLTINGGTGPYQVNWNIMVLDGPDLTGLAPGMYTPTIIDANGCGLPGAPIEISEPTAISIAIDQVDDVSCNGGSDGAIAITASGGTPIYTYEWSNGPSTKDLAGIPAGNYTPTVTDSEGCTQTISAITVNEPSAISGNAVVDPIKCDGDTNGAVDLSPSGGNAPYTFLWSGGLGTGEDVSNLSPGSYTVTITDASGCTLVDGPFDFTNPTPITINETINMPTVANNDGSINLMVSGGTGPYTYNWTGPLGPYTGEPLNGLGSGEYRVTVTDANDCVAFETYFLVGDFSTNGQVTDASCNGGSDGTIELNVQGGIGPYLYDWNYNSNTASDLIGIPAGNNYCVTVTDVPTMAVIIECFVVGEAPPMDITILNVINETGTGCNGSVNVSVTGGNPPYDYLWSNGATSKNISDVCKGDYTLAITDATGCYMESQVITVLASPIVCEEIITTDTKCHDTDDGTVQVLFFGGCGPYTIQLSIGIPKVSNDGDVTFTGLPMGMYTGNIRDNQGSLKPFTFEIESPEPIVIMEEGIVHNTGGTACNGIIDISVTGGVGPYAYTWSRGDTSEDIFNVCGGAITYSVTVVDANGCVAEMGGFIVEDRPEIQIDLTTQLNETCFEACDGQLIVLASGGVAPFTYAWSNSVAGLANIGLCQGVYSLTVTDGIGSTAEQIYVITGASSALTQSGVVTDAQGAANNGSILLTVVGGVTPYSFEWSNGSTTNPTTALGVGVYNVVITDANGCVIDGAYTVNSDILLLSAEGDTPSCSGDTDGCIEIFPQTGDEPFIYQWSTGQSSKKICTLAGGTYTVTVTDSKGLTAVVDYLLEDPNPIVVNAESLGAGSAEATVSGGTGTYTYSWNDSNNSTTALVEGLRPGSYGVLVTDENGCSGQGVLDMRPEGDCQDVRQVISPNGDARNDEFMILCAYEYTENTLEVFDRYGRLIYQAENYDNTWIGTDQGGTALPEGGYFWVFKYRDADGVLETVKGHVTIIIN